MNRCQDGEVSRSEEISRSFYARLGASRLARRTRPEYDELAARALLEILPASGRVLDVGCGYGRIALRLARAGYRVDGLDLSEALIEAAHAAARAERLPVRLVIGTMTRLPYSSASFDVVICLWSAFFELLEDDEQVRAVREMWRVLRPGGFGLIEGPTYREPTEDEISSGERRGREARIVWGKVEGFLNPHYAHDERSLGRICAGAGVESYRVFERDWAGRQRLVLWIDSPTGSLTS
jgi:SAM-dependent methyltransferase